MRRPPRVPRRLLGALVPPGPRGDSMLGDLHEEWETRRRRHRMGAWLWYWGAASLLAGGLAPARIRRSLAGVGARFPAALTAEQLVHDGRISARNLARRPLFTLVAVVSLVVGIGANTAIFSVVNRLFLRPLAGIGQVERVVELGSSWDGAGFDSFSYPDFHDLGAETATFASVAAWRPGNMSWSPEGAGGVRLTTLFVSSAYFDVLGVAPWAGRFFDPSVDVGVAEHPLAVVSHGFWEDALGSDPDVVGRTIELNRESHTIVGVAPPDFRSHVVGLNPHAWIPLMQIADVREAPEIVDNRGSSWFALIARLAPDVTLARADAVTRTLFRRLGEEYPETNGRRGATVLPLGPVPGGGRKGVGVFVMALTGLVAVVLMVTCANVAGMLLARGASRTREIAVRSALGASRSQLARYLGMEALLLFLVGGAAGMVGANALLSRLTLASLPIPFSVRLDLSLDGPVLAYGLIVTFLTGLLFGALPAARVSRVDPIRGFRGENGMYGAGTQRLRRTFVSGQVGMSILLLAAAGLFLRSLQHADRIGAGFDPDGVVVTTLDLSMEGYREAEEGRVFQQRLLEAVASIPGAEGAALSQDLPLDLGAHGTGVVLDHPDAGSGEETFGVDVNSVTPSYFDVLRIPRIRGRTFDQRDSPESPRVAVVSRTFGEQAWPGEDPLGRSFLFRGSERFIVIGVVEDVKNQVLTEQPRPMLYTLMAQEYRPVAVLTVRVPGVLDDVGPVVRSSVLEVDPSLSLTPVVALSQHTGLAILPQRIAASVTSSLGLVALALSALGIYGVVAFSVSQRTREIGLRMALGAGQRTVVGGVVRGALVLSLPGLVVGGLAALGVGPVLSSLLIGVGPLDPVALGGVASVLFLVVLGASVIPARRASRIRPMDALRHE